MEEREIIQKLSELHKWKATDPQILCGATFHEFDLDRPDSSQYFELQGKLFQICHERGYGWTKV